VIGKSSKDGAPPIANAHGGVFCTLSYPEGVRRSASDPGWPLKPVKFPKLGFFVWAPFDTFAMPALPLFGARVVAVNSGTLANQGALAAAFTFVPHAKAALTFSLCIMRTDQQDGSRRIVKTTGFHIPTRRRDYYRRSLRGGGLTQLEFWIKRL